MLGRKFLSALRGSNHWRIDPGLAPWAAFFRRFAAGLSLPAITAPSPFEDGGEVLVLYDRRERLWIQAGAAYQRAVDFFLRHQRLGVLWLYRSAVEDA